MGCLPAESIHSRAGGLPHRQGEHPNSRALPSGLPPAQNDQFVTSVVIRFGTSPTGMTALTVLLSVSMAVTDLMAALEM